MSWFRTNPEPDMRRDIEREREREREEDADRRAEAQHYETERRRSWWRKLTNRRAS